MSVMGFAERFNITELFQPQGKAVAKHVENNGLPYVTAAHDTNDQKGGNILCLVFRHTVIFTKNFGNLKFFIFEMY